ncbi:MAG: carbonic anhydrase [Halobacteriovoraceae bacterium]|nr:carbonic anhydrase [Halobacteriovoraceae bacterium]|tara:strand:+ start:3198 stop:3773 length:576 start_codon:yes stop_codon:yes gene_type:complete
MYAYKGYEKYKKEKLATLKPKLAGIENGQSPKTLFITCSDSRICPNELTSSEQGELFVIRNAGNTIPHFDKSNGNADAATLEYAVKALGVEEIIVCGHTHCGAIGALMTGVDANQLGTIASYLSELNELRELSLERKMTGIETIKENIKFQLENIHSYDFVQQAMSQGKLKTYGWIYGLETGEVELVDCEA